MRKELILVAVALLSHPSHAQDAKQLEPDHANCRQGNQQELNRCMADRLAGLDAQLNALYRQLIASLEHPSSLKKAQAAWIRFRDLSCRYETSGISEDGSILPYAQNGCLADFTERRIEDLDRYIQDDCNGCPPRKSTVPK